jgi:hypothetical protein
MSKYRPICRKPFARQPWRLVFYPCVRLFLHCVAPALPQRLLGAQM